MSTHERDHEQDQPQDGSEEETELPEHPADKPIETVEALEDRLAGSDDDADEEQVRGDDVTESPDADEMEGLPGPPPGEPDEPAG
ncbi:hypothetical protein [Nocardioides sp. GXQ0305]|uniref:hypothetical protein n=1 Tax=Nocardioides sp. GXQ0305 TaxID=3423912 RepID=UPI003D7E73B6